MTLVSTLCSYTAQFHQETAAAEIRKYEDEVTTARAVAKEVVSRLPDFLANAAKEGFSSVYVVGIDQYRPWSFQWPEGKKVSQDASALSEYACKQLFGVPRHVALWALKADFKVKIESDYHYYYGYKPELRVFDYLKYGRQYAGGQGISLFW